MGKKSEPKKISPDTPEKARKDEYPEKKDQFTDVSGIAHDLNNVLNIISGYSEILQEELPASSAYREYTEKIISGVSKARLLTGELLAIDRFSEQEVAISDVASVLTDSVEFIKSVLPANIYFTADIPPAGFIVKTRPVNIFRILLNLIKNAIQSMGSKDGKISARVFLADRGQIVNLFNNILKDQKYIALSVKDTGPGIDNKSLTRIFEPYFTTSSEKGGRGLGLSIVKQIIIEMNGGINVISRPGEGTEFRIYLPLIS